MQIKVLSVTELQWAGGDCVDKIAHLIEEVYAKALGLLSRLHRVDACRQEEVGYRLLLSVTHGEFIDNDREYGLIVIG